MREVFVGIVSSFVWIVAVGYMVAGLSKVNLEAISIVWTLEAIASVIVPYCLAHGVTKVIRPYS